MDAIQSGIPEALIKVFAADCILVPDIANKNADHNNLDHAVAGRLIDSAVYREWTVGADDAGAPWIFEFDAKLGNLTSPTTALAFIKTLDPNNGYLLTNLLTVDTTTIPATWERYSISILIDAGLVGQLLQIGFSNFCAAYVPSGVFYDNIVFHNAVSTAVEPTWGQTRRERPSATVSPNPINPAGVPSFKTAPAARRWHQASTSTGCRPPKAWPGDNFRS